MYAVEWLHLQTSLSQGPLPLIWIADEQSPHVGTLVDVQRKVRLPRRVLMFLDWPCQTCQAFVAQANPPRLFCFLVEHKPPVPRSGQLYLGQCSLSQHLGHEQNLESHSRLVNTFVNTDEIQTSHETSSQMRPEKHNICEGGPGGSCPTRSLHPLRKSQGRAALAARCSQRSGRSRYDRVGQGSPGQPMHNVMCLFVCVAKTSVCLHYSRPLPRAPAKATPPQIVEAAPLITDRGPTASQQINARES
jgi:hypothetical protein